MAVSLHLLTRAAVPDARSGVAVADGGCLESTEYRRMYDQAAMAAGSSTWGTVSLPNPATS